MDVRTNSTLNQWQADGLGRQYGTKEVLQNVSFKLSQGQVLGLFGPNGSGKSTLLEILALAARPTAGSFIYGQQNVLASVRDFRPRIGYVPQDIALFEELTVMDNLLCWTRLPREQARQRIAAIASALSLDVFVNQRVQTLSGGMKRRVNLAVAMLGSPSLLVLDEPLAGVDLEHQEIMLEFLRQMAGQGVSQIISSHAIDDLLPMIDQIMILREGYVLFYGSREDFLARAGQLDPQQALRAILTGQLP